MKSSSQPPVGLWSSRVVQPGGVPILGGGGVPGDSSGKTKMMTRGNRQAG